MFITKKRCNGLRSEAWRKGWNSATADLEEKFFFAADQVAREATRTAPTGKQAEVYAETYNQVYDHLVSKHTTNQEASG